jgi:hypothetical protein
MRMFGIPSYLVYAILMGCAAPKSTASSSSSNGGYSEDLSVLRPKAVAQKTDSVITKAPDKKNTVYVEPKFAVNEKIDEVLDSIDRINIARKYVEGYTVQVFSGKREDAINMRKQLSTLVSEIPSEIQFTEPIFRLKAGKYYNWIDAQADFSLIKRYFPAAIVIPDKIPLQAEQK